MADIDGRLRIVRSREDREIRLVDSEEAYCAISIDEVQVTGFKLTILLTPNETWDLLSVLLEAAKKFKGVTGEADG